MTSRRVHWLDVTVLALVALLLVLPLRTPVNVYDEGNILVGSQRLLAGDVPYRDFWGVYPPGQLWAVAGALSIWGHDVIGPRIFDTVVRLATVAAAFALVLRLAGRPLALAAAATVGVALAAVGRHYLYPVQPAMLAAMLALLVWLRTFDETSRATRARAACGSGALLGVAALFRWDIAAYAAVGLLLAGVLASLNPDRRLATRARAALGLGTGAAAVIATLGYAATALSSGVGPLLDQVFVFPLTGLHDARRLPVPRPWDLRLDPGSTWALFYLLVVLLLVLGLSVAIILVRARARLDVRQLAFVALSGFAVSALAQGLSRTDRSHLLPATLMAVLALTVLVAERHESKRLLGPLARLLPIVLAVALAATSFVGLRVVVRDAIRYPTTRCQSSLPAASCVFLSSDQQAAVDFVTRASRPTEPILVANRQNARISVNDSSFYFLADRPPATPYEELHPGVADTLVVQSQIVDRLQRDRVRWVVLVTMPDFREPNLSSRGYGVTVLDDHLRDHYTPRFTEGAYEVLELS